MVTLVATTMAVTMTKAMMVASKALRISDNHDNNATTLRHDNADDADDNADAGGDEADKDEDRGQGR